MIITAIFLTVVLHFFVYKSFIDKKIDMKNFIPATYSMDMNNPLGNKKRIFIYEACLILGLFVLFPLNIYSISCISFIIYFFVFKV